ncbi:hypothetical protein SH661x_001470 [Planctomicrobium sp. SH661]|uniref:hypothetical protein n=1 Tax=Planctomicrobium sp. SH661 TaxID=3448124 RepID=UPI003F5BC808
MMKNRVKFDLALTRFTASVLIFASHCATLAIQKFDVTNAGNSLLVFYKEAFGLPSLVILCLMTGIAENLTPGPDISDKAGLVNWLNNRVGLWFRLSVVFNVFYANLFGLILSQALFGHAVKPPENPVLDILLGYDGFWYLSALVYWSLARIWIRTNRQMKLFCCGLLIFVLILMFFPNEGVCRKLFRVSRLMTGLFFISAGFLLGPTFFGKLARATKLQIAMFIACMSVGFFAMELYGNLLFPSVKVVVFHLQPPTSLFPSKTIAIGNFLIPVSVVSYPQLILRWVLIFGCAIGILYVTSRLGAKIPSKLKVLPTI